MPDLPLLPVVVPEAFWARRFRCPHCTTLTRASRSSVKAHMGRCWSNPAVRACRTCARFEPGGDGQQCEPGRPCDCNNQPEQCHAGVELTGEMVTGCPLWESNAPRPRDDHER